MLCVQPLADGGESPNVAEEDAAHPLLSAELELFGLKEDFVDDALGEVELKRVSYFSLLSTLCEVAVEAHADKDRYRLQRGEERQEPIAVRKENQGVLSLSDLESRHAQFFLIVLRP